MRILLTLSYDGSAYRGWQRQKNLDTVQGRVEAALKSLYGTDVAVTPGGRTDKGVHAYAQTAHFDCEKLLPEKNIVSGLNYFLPPDVAVLSACAVAPDFSARRSKQKTYLYDMYFADADFPLLRNRALRISRNTDAAAMKAAAPLLCGEHDFKPFRALGSSAKTTVRTVYECALSDVELCSQKALRLTITANGFLYKMVRIVAATLLKIGSGSLTAETLKALLESGREWNRKTAAPPHGLYLFRIDY
ncbi:MAG: tRNA pseudouridine(38-40) synthase TruA [Clostridiales bacterium]|jgi:tRNA pseudouridine38-40 synthase|nr:tRNA pseudouridine(38-40) synthase TruA [Clostridiales bacterium]